MDFGQIFYWWVARNVLASGLFFVANMDAAKSDWLWMLRGVNTVFLIMLGLVFALDAVGLKRYAGLIVPVIGIFLAVAFVKHTEARNRREKTDEN